MNWLSSSSEQSFIELLRAARSTIKRYDPWMDILRNVRGKAGGDGVARVATDALFDILDLPRLQRTPQAGKRIKAIMVELGWAPVRAKHVTSRGRAARVRGYARFS